MEKSEQKTTDDQDTGADDIQAGDNSSLEELKHPDLADQLKQELYRQEYLRQLRLRSCPGCGDDGMPPM